MANMGMNTGMNMATGQPTGQPTASPWPTGQGQDTVRPWLTFMHPPTAAQVAARMIPEPIRRFVHDVPPPFYVPLSARWRQSFAYFTVHLRMAIMLDMTLLQFHQDMEELLAEEEKMLEQLIEEGMEEADESCTCGDSPDGTARPRSAASALRPGSQPSSPCEGTCTKLCVSPKRSVEWVCKPPPWDYSDLEDMAMEDPSEFNLAIQSFLWTLTGLKIKRKIPRGLKSREQTASPELPREKTPQSPEMKRKHRPRSREQRTFMAMRDWKHLGLEVVQEHPVHAHDLYAPHELEEDAPPGAVHAHILGGAEPWHMMHHPAVHTLAQHHLGAGQHPELVAHLREQAEGHPHKPITPESPPRNVKTPPKAPGSQPTSAEGSRPKAGENDEEGYPPCHPLYTGRPPKSAAESGVSEYESIYDDPRFEEWKRVELAIMEMKRDIELNRWFRPLETDAPDAATWNQFLFVRAREEGAPKLRWFCTIWMYTECYFFRRIAEIFEREESLRCYDPFRKVKENNFHAKLEGMDKVAVEFEKVITLCPLPKPDSEHTGMFLRMFLMLSLWANREDLMKGGPTSAVSDFTGGNPLVRAQTFGTALLVDELHQVWITLLDKDPLSDRRVDIMLQDAGFELFCDMLVADFLITYRLAETVHLHAKAMPWYMMHATRRDILRLIELMAQSREKSVTLARLAERWYDYIACGRWVIEDDYYWTLPYDYNDMRCLDGPLYVKLTYSRLLIFKGDLHYRKLLGDVNWEPTIPLSTAVRHFHPTNFIALRAFRSDIICGVPLSTRVYMTVPKGWMLTGKYAVAQFVKRKKCVPGLPGPP